jgi:carboxymethylenebutenolidase
MSKFSRREVVASGLGAGFALAARPVTAQVINTSDDGLVVGDVKIPVADGSIPGFRAAPRGAKNPPIMLVVQEIFGVHEHIKDVCRRFAKLGYLAVAPELFVRQGDVAKMKDIEQIRTQVVARVPDAQVMADLDATAAWAGNPKAGKGDRDRLGIVGFCWGGRQVWLYAAHNPALKAGVAFYGRLVGDRTANTPRHPSDLVPALKAPVMGLYGGADPGIPMGTITDMQTALKKAGKPSIVRVYPAAGHAFFADYRPSYRKEDALDAWSELKDWFRRQRIAPASRP